MKYKSAKGWCIVSPQGQLMGFMWHELRGDCMAALIARKKKYDNLQLTWLQLENLGYRCVKARVSVS